MNRRTDSATERFAFGEFELDVSRSVLTHRGCNVKLRPKAFDLLSFLVAHDNQICTKQELVTELWPMLVVTDDSLVKCVRDVRQALGREGDSFIRTVPRRGYLFEGEVRILQQRQSLSSTGLLPNSVAVLPVANLGPSQDNAYFASGLHETLLHHLSRAGSISTIARTTMSRYEQTAKSLAEIAQELKVQTVLEGSVRDADGRIMVTLQLIDPATAAHLWSAQYESQTTDVFSAQNQIARNVTTALHMILAAPGSGPPQAAPVVDDRAYQLYLRGRYHWDKTTRRDLDKSVEYYEQALLMEPDFALAYAGLADAFAFRHALGAPLDSGFIAKARQAAERAMALDPSLPEAHVSSALIRYFVDMDYLGGNRDFERAIALNPRCAVAHHLFGKNLVVTGRFAESRQQLELALASDPFSNAINKDIGELSYFERNPSLALDELQKSLEMEPGDDGAYFYIVRCHEAMAETEQAILTDLEWFRSINTRLGDELSSTYLESGAPGYWRARLLLTEQSARHRYVEPYRWVELYVRLNEPDEAFKWLDVCMQSYSAWVPLLLVDPLMDPLRDDHRFERLLKRCGFAAFI